RFSGRICPMIHPTRRSMASGQTGNIGVPIHLCSHIDGERTSRYTCHVEGNGFNFVLTQIIDIQKMRTSLCSGDYKYILSVESTSPGKQGNKGRIHRMPQIVVGMVVYLRICKVCSINRNQQTNRDEIFPKTLVVDDFD